MKQSTMLNIATVLLLIIVQVYSAPKISKPEVMDSIKRLIADVEDEYNYAWFTINSEESVYWIYCDLETQQKNITGQVEIHLKSLNKIKNLAPTECLADQEQNLLQLQKVALLQIAACTPQQVCDIGYGFFDLTRNVLRNNLRTIQDLRTDLRKCADDDELCISNIAAVLPSLQNYPSKFTSIGTSLRFTSELVDRVNSGCQDEVFGNLKSAAAGILQEVETCVGQ